jgi:hypothetical protein
MGRAQVCLIDRKGRAQVCMIDGKGRAQVCLIDENERAPVGQGALKESGTIHYWELTDSAYSVQMV